MSAKNHRMKTQSLVARVSRAADWCCPDCDYPFRGSLDSYDDDRDSLRCPECGREWAINSLQINNEILDKVTPWWWYGLAAGLPAAWILVLCGLATAAGEHPLAIRFQQGPLLLSMSILNVWLGWWHTSRAKSVVGKVARATIYFLIAFIIGMVSMFFTYIGVAIVTAPFAP